MPDQGSLTVSYPMLRMTHPSRNFFALSKWGRLSTVDLFVLIIFEQLIFILKILLTCFYKTSYLSSVRKRGKWGRVKFLRQITTESRSGANVIKLFCP